MSTYNFEASDTTVPEGSSSDVSVEDSARPASSPPAWAIQAQPNPAKELFPSSQRSRSAMPPTALHFGSVAKGSAVMFKPVATTSIFRSPKEFIRFGGVAESSVASSAPLSPTSETMPPPPPRLPQPTISDSTSASASAAAAAAATAPEQHSLRMLSMPPAASPLESFGAGPGLAHPGPAPSQPPSKQPPRKVKSDPNADESPQKASIAPVVPVSGPTAAAAAPPPDADEALAAAKSAALPALVAASSLTLKSSLDILDKRRSTESGIGSLPWRTEVAGFCAVPAIAAKAEAAVAMAIADWLFTALDDARADKLRADRACALEAALSRTLGSTS